MNSAAFVIFEMPFNLAPACRAASRCRPGNRRAPHGAFRRTGLCLHLPRQKCGDGLAGLALRLANDGLRLERKQDDRADRIALGDDGDEQQRCGRLLALLCDAADRSVSRILQHQHARKDRLFHIRGDGLVGQLLFAASGAGNDHVLVADQCAVTEHLMQRADKFCGEGSQLPDRRILFENDSALMIRKDLQRATLVDAQCAANLLGDNDSSELIPLCQERDKKINDFFKKPGAAWLLSFLKR